MALANYSDLQATVIDWLERDDLTEKVTDYIALAESRIKKAFAAAGLRLREQETRTDVTPSSGTVTLPSDFQAMKTVQVRTSSPRRLEYKTMEWLDEAYPSGASGNPDYYGIVGGTLYMFPLSTSDMRLEYYAYPSALSTGNTTNWLLTKYPDVYLYATLLEADAAAGKGEGSKWGGLFRDSLASLSAAGFGAEMTPGTSRTAAAMAW